MPPLKGCSAWIHDEKAWVARVSTRTTEGPKSKTVPWGGKEGISHTGALMAVLEWAWDRAHEVDKTLVCPYDLSAIVTE